MKKYSNTPFLGQKGGILGKKYSQK